MVSYNMIIGDIRAIRFYKKKGYYYCSPDTPHQISEDINYVVGDLTFCIMLLPFTIVIDIVLSPFELLSLLLNFLIKHCYLKK